VIEILTRCIWSVGNFLPDFFWGFGAEAGELAGKMKQAGSMWVL
jgi:membrane-bound lytic murein transglycosylase